MKFSIRIALLIAVFSISFINSFGQNTDEKFISGKGGFSIDLPKSFTLLDKTGFDDAELDATGEYIIWNKPPNYYAQVQYFHIYTESKKLSEKQKKYLLESFKKNTIEGIKDQSVSVTDVPFSFKGKDGKQVEIEFSEAKSVTRIFIVDNTLYVTSALVYGSKNTSKALKILDSFELLDEETHSAQLIIETDIKSLPQTPITEKLKSDAEDNNLKGKVKIITEYTKDSPKDKKYKSEENFYNEQGNIVKEIWYSKNYPIEFTVWGYIDGKRVSNSKNVDYGTPFNRFEKTGVMMITEINPDESTSEYDERYIYKYGYKYNKEVQLAEETLTMSNNKLWQRRVYNYKNNQKETLYYSEDGSLNMKTVEILDKSGNVIEVFSIFEGEIESITTYTYKFDEKGNWIEQKSFEKTRVKGKIILKPSTITYRTISYY